MIEYLLFLLATALLLIRPTEMVPTLEHLPLYLMAIAGAVLFGANSLQMQLRWETMRQQPVILCMLGMILAIAASRLTTGHTDGLVGSVVEMVKIAVYFLLLVALINTPQRLRQFLLVIAVSATVMITYSLVDYRGFTAHWMAREDMAEVIYAQNRLPRDEWFLRHIPDRNGVDLYGNEIFFFRLCGLGIFSDPNDLSLLIVMTSIIALYFMADRQLSAMRFLWIGPLIVMGIAMHFTYSRGGLLAAGFAFTVWLLTRYGAKVAMGVGALAAACVPVMLGRAGNIDLEGGTGQQRIQFWGEGLAAIRNQHFLFGIGEGRFIELSDHVAHNSYIHAFVELGFAGGTLFFGAFFIPALTFFLMKRHDFQIDHPELRRMFPYIAAILADWLMGMSSLSRCYVPSTYLIAGLCAAYINLVGFYRLHPRPLLVLNARTVKPWLACSGALLVGAYLFVRVFARWGA